jgi:hypothetical protein
MLLAAAAGGEARGQSVAFGPPLPIPSAAPPVQVALGPWSAPPAPDLWVGELRADGSGFFGFYRRGDLAELPLSWTMLQVGGSCFTAGSWVAGPPASPGDGKADLAWCAASDLRYDLSFTPPAPPPDFGLAYLREGKATGLAFARLLDRADLVLAIAEAQQIEIAPDPWGFPSQGLYYPAPVIAQAAPTFALQPLRLGTVARGQGLDDLAWSRVGRPDLFVLWTLQASSQGAVADWDGRLLAFAGALEVRGAGAVDTDGDGIPDLLAVVVPVAGSPALLALHNPGTPFSIDPASAVDVGTALGLSAPAFAAPLDLDGVPAAAVFDAGTSLLQVVTADPSGGLRSWPIAALPAWGAPTQVLAGDLVGSAAADLVAVFSDGTIRVWPGDLPPSIAWAPGSPPAEGVTSASMTLEVDASDADGTLAAVDLRLQGQPSGIVPVQAGGRYTFTIPAATLCGLGTSADVAVRATDDLGAWREVARSIPIADKPGLALPGEGSTQAVPLLPGGTSVVLTAQATDGCGRPLSVTWVEESGLPPGASSSAVTTDGTSVYTLLVPEPSYPLMVASGGMSVPVTVTASAGASPVSAGVTLGFDASGFLSVEQSSDRAVLAPGELAQLTTTLRSRLGVTLPQVALADRLSGLVAAGPPRVTGAALVGWSDDGSLVTLDQVAGGGAPVVVRLAVRLAADGGGSSSAQVLAVPSGVPLSGAVDVAAPAAAPRAGVSCGSGGASPLWLLGLLAYMKAMRRVPARTRSTSSRTPMTRQAWRKASASRSGRSESLSRSVTVLVPSAAASRWASAGRSPRA